ncbi:EamA family transporter [bacterium CG17_big_fil_post_rev_8_21_14_2_50_64_8]|nr:MAG: EamA family transporter [bacterium CG17_big_fil_post_rev_8_21_14_2_50_64_8]PJA76547.1 MAG: EamA family transporter [bacterium CG_4_9_14_3_um_filter_65_15]
MPHLADRAPRPDSLGRAVAWMILSGASFALMGAMVKLATEASVPAKVFFRNLVTLVITTAVAWRSGHNPLARTPHRGLLLLRAFCGLAGVFLYFVALSRLTLADASLLNKTSPFFVVAFAVLILHEPWHRTMAPILLLAFGGALLIIKPGFNYQMLPALAGLGSGAFAGLAYTLVRKLKGRADPNQIIFHFSLVSTLVTLPFVLWHPLHVDAGQWLALIGTGVFAAGGQYGLTFAYHHAPASRISIYTYLHVLFAVAGGFALFGERPDLASIFGGLLIIAAAVGSQRINRERRQT